MAVKEHSCIVKTLLFQEYSKIKLILKIFLECQNENSKICYFSFLLTDVCKHKQNRMKKSNGNRNKVSIPYFLLVYFFSIPPYSINIFVLLSLQKFVQVNICIYQNKTVAKTHDLIQRHNLNKLGLKQRSQSTVFVMENSMAFVCCFCSQT